MFRTTCTPRKNYRKIAIERRKVRMPSTLPSQRRELSPVERTRSVWKPWSRYGQHKRAKQTCALLAKLPLEIRLQIWNYAIGDSILHIITLKKRAGHVECRHDSGMDIERDCFPQPYWHPVWTDEPSKDGNGLDRDLLGSRLALLCTCRHIYAETTPVLYERNRFDFATPESFNWFTRRLRPPRLDIIQSLSLGLFQTLRGGGSAFIRARDEGYGTYDRDGFWGPYWPGRYNLALEWDPMWEIVKNKMPGLRHLYVVVSKVYGPGDDPQKGWSEVNDQRMAVQPMRGLKGLRSFVLQMRRVKGSGASALDYAVEELLPETRLIIKQACIDTE